MTKSVYAIYEPHHEKTCLCHMRTTKAEISPFVVRWLDSLIPLLAISKISRLVSLCSWASQFESYLVANPEDRFSHDEAHNYGNNKDAICAVWSAPFLFAALRQYNTYICCIPNSKIYQLLSHSSKGMFSYDVTQILTFPWNNKLVIAPYILWSSAAKPETLFQFECFSWLCPLKQKMTTNEPQHDKTNKMTCAPSEDSDQPGHPPSLIRVFAVHSIGSLGPKVFSCRQLRL